MSENYEYPLPDEDGYADFFEAKEPLISSRKKSTAILLAVFFGVLGIHSFYLGFTRKGLMQIVASLCGLSVIWALVDIVQMLFSSELHDADGNLVV